MRLSEHSCLARRYLIASNKYAVRVFEQLYLARRYPAIRNKYNLPLSQQAGALGTHTGCSLDVSTLLCAPGACPESMHVPSSPCRVESQLQAFCTRAMSRVAMTSVVSCQGQVCSHSLLVKEAGKSASILPVWQRQAQLQGLETHQSYVRL